MYQFIFNTLLFAGDTLMLVLEHLRQRFQDFLKPWAELGWQCHNNTMVEKIGEKNWENMASLIQAFAAIILFLCQKTVGDHELIDWKPKDNESGAVYDSTETIKKNEQGFMERIEKRTCFKAGAVDTLQRHTTTENSIFVPIIR